jgi:glycosyltransferase involved in cell wall biosynthesis
LPLEQHVRLSASLPEPSFAPWALFFGRFQRYKGLEVLLAAQSLLAQKTSGQGVVLAGGGDIDSIWPNPLPQGVTVLNRHIQSEEGWQLFQRCGVLVLPYTGATQSALPAAAYAFGKPVIVTTSGALPEAVQPGVTGWVVPAGNPKALADCLSSVMCDSKLLAAAGAAGRRWYEEARQRQPVELATFYAATIAAHHGPVHDKRIPEL